jgi:hypothetical protein
LAARICSSIEPGHFLIGEVISLRRKMHQGRKCENADYIQVRRHATGLNILDQRLSREIRKGFGPPFPPNGTARRGADRDAIGKRVRTTPALLLKC